MFKKFWQWITDWLISDFPDAYPPECFDCNEGSCDGCEIKNDWKD